MVIVFANWFDPRLITIFGFTTDAGTLIFPFTFLLSDILTEVYGYKHARRAIWCGFLFNILFIAYGQLVIHMPSPNYTTQNEIFDSLLSTNIRIIIASSLSYFSSEPLNSFLMAKLKIRMQGHYLGLRFLASTIVAAGIDSFIFGYLAFFNAMNQKNLLSLIITMWFIKIVIEFLGLPISVRLAKKLKKSERLDIYDDNTNFNIFNLSASYLLKDNHYPVTLK